MRKRERFRSALAVSCALHLFLLWPAVFRDREGETANVLSVVLAPGKSPLPVSAPSSAAAAPVHARRAVPENRLLVSEEGPRVPQDASDPPRTDTPASTAEITRRSDRPPGGAAAASRDGAPQAAAAPAPLLDADGVRQYRIALAVEARRFKRYPQSALADEIGGTVEVRIAVAAGGQAQDVALARSSGYGALDEAALEMMRKAAPRAAVPELLRRRSFVVDLPVVFDVANE